MEEYNQCQSRLKELHLAGVPGVSMDEFIGYRLIYSLYRENHRYEGGGRDRGVCGLNEHASTMFCVYIRFSGMHTPEPPPPRLLSDARHPLFLVRSFSGRLTRP